MNQKNQKIKKIILQICETLLLLTIVSLGYPNEKNLLSTEVLPLLSGVINASYEKAVSEKSSFSIGAGFLKYSLPDWELSGTAIKTSYKIFPSKNALRGLYIGPTIGIISISAKHTYDEVRTTETGDTVVETKTSSANGSFFGIGGCLGYRWIWTNHVALDLYLSIGSISGEIKVGGERAPFGGTSIGYGVKIGYAW